MNIADGTFVGQQKRFDSIEHENDWIMNICTSSNDDDKDVYVVGATMGSISGGLASN
jgi:hypothetical protein